MPLFVALGGASRREAIALGITYTLVFSLGGLEPWFARATSAYFAVPLARMVAYTAPPLALLAVFHGTVLGTGLSLRPRRAGAADVVFCAALWVCWEYLRTLVFPYYPAAFIGLSQHATLPVLQLASVTGIAGVTFVLVACNVGLAALLAPGGDGRGRRVLAAAVGLAAAAGAITFGMLRVAGDPARASDGARIAAVDLNARERSASTLEGYLGASEPAAADRPALVLWPESALLVDPEHSPAVWSTLGAFVAAHRTSLLAGGPGSAPRADGRWVQFNSAHLLTPGHGLRSYHKRGLVPLAERWPSLLGTPPPDLPTLEVGREATVFRLDQTAFGVLICFEITDAAGARALARDGARFIANITNDVWFAGSARPPHLPWAAVRAVESGLPVVRAANAGRSAVFDRLGREVAGRASSDGPSVLAASVPPARPTLYAQSGDVFLVACLAGVLAGAVSRARRAGPGHRGRSP